MVQNTSHAVMAQRIEAADSPDDFPTPPWATRALIEHVLEDKKRAGQNDLPRTGMWCRAHGQGAQGILW